MSKDKYDSICKISSELQIGIVGLNSGNYVKTTDKYYDSDILWDLMYNGYIINNGVSTARFVNSVIGSLGSFCVKIDKLYVIFIDGKFSFKKNIDDEYIECGTIINS